MISGLIAGLLEVIVYDRSRSSHRSLELLPYRTLGVESIAIALVLKFELRIYFWAEISTG
jgi:hypothetical protein